LSFIQEDLILDEYDDFDLVDEPEEERPHDLREREALKTLQEFFRTHREQVFFSRQLEILHEDVYFHWITNRALRELREAGLLVGETRSLKTGGSINLVWYRGYRFYRRSAARLVTLVEEYADPNIGGVVGLHGEFMVLEGFARSEFVMRGRNTREFAGKVWTQTGHNLDFIFERDGRAYGVEVKNTLGYMDYDEFRTKIRICKFLGIHPVFAARMLPKTWMNELITGGGYGLIMKYQLYPWTHKELAKRVASELGLPVDAPRTLAEGTMHRFLKWHRTQL
jgi:hypothetical protein